MRQKTIFWDTLLIVAAIVASPWAVAAWQVVATESGKRVEIERDSIVIDANGEARARGRIVLDKAIIDPRTASSFRIIEISNRFDCKERTYATLKRTYYKENGEILRQEDVRVPDSMPVRSGTPDDRLFREACRTDISGGSRPPSARQTVERVNEAATELRQINQSMIEKEAKKNAQNLPGHLDSSIASLEGGGRRDLAKGRKKGAATVAWGYEGAGGPELWGALRRDYGKCASGRQQSPIDIRDGIAVDLEPLQFSYRPEAFRVVDAGRNIVVVSDSGGLSLLGKNYALMQIEFHRPGETRLGGRTFEMEVQLQHRADDGQLAIVSVLLERGVENPVIQTILNNLPLERGGEVAPPEQLLDLERLLPADRRYFAFMGSLTTPPCTENVLWLVFKEPQRISGPQLDIFARLYPPNARPVQPSASRIIKESR